MKCHGVSKIWDGNIIIRKFQQISYYPMRDTYLSIETLSEMICKQRNLKTDKRYGD